MGDLRSHILVGSSRRIPIVSGRVDKNLLEVKLRIKPLVMTWLQRIIPELLSTTYDPSRGTRGRSDHKNKEQVRVKAKDLMIT